WKLNVSKLHGQSGFVHIYGLSDPLLRWMNDAFYLYRKHRSRQVPKHGFPVLQKAMPPYFSVLLAPKQFHLSSDIALIYLQFPSSGRDTIPPPVRYEASLLT